MLGRRSVSWTDFPICLILGEAAKERRRDSDPHPPHPRHDRDIQMTTTLSRSTRLCQTNGHDRWQDPSRGPSSSYSVVRRSNNPTTIRVATESQSREGTLHRTRTSWSQSGGSGNSNHTAPPGVAAAAGGSGSNGHRADQALLRI